MKPSVLLALGVYLLVTASTLADTLPQEVDEESEAAKPRVVLFHHLPFLLTTLLFLPSPSIFISGKKNWGDVARTENLIIIPCAHQLGQFQT